MVTGDQTPANGAVIEGKLIRGRIKRLSGVSATYRNCVVEMPAVTSGDPLNLVESWGTGGTITFEDCTLRVPAANRSFRASGGIHGSGVVVRRTLLIGFVDAFCPAGVGQKGSWLAENFEIAQTMHYVDPAVPQSDGMTHDDSVDIYGNLSSVILRNGVISNAHGSAVFVKGSRLAGGIDELVLEGLSFPVTNRPTGYGILVQFAPEDSVITNAAIRQCLFSTKDVSSIPRILADQEQLDALDIVATGAMANGWLDDGTPPSTIVPVWRGTGSSPAMYTAY